MPEPGDKKMSRPPWTTGTNTVKEVSLQWLYVHRRRAFIPLLDIKADSLTLVKGLEALALNRTEMYKDIPAFIILDKAKPFFLVEPLYLTLCQCCTPLSNKVSKRASHPSRQKKTTPFQNRILNG
jgi:hypothetical protein